MHKVRPLGVLVAAAIVIACAVAWALWLRSPRVPAWAVWEERSLVADLEGDGSYETLTIKDRRLLITGEDGSSCQSDGAWLVEDVLVGDIDRDGGLEVALVVWKRGSYGPYRPFWVARDTDAYSQHVFVMRYAEGRLVPLWMSSALGIEVVGSWMDGSARVALLDRAGEVTLWEWGSWGLELADQGEGPANATAVSVAAGDASPMLTLVATGDCIAHETVLAAGRQAANEAGYDFSGVFAPVAPWVSSFDVAVVTQETPLVSREEDVASYPRFGTPCEMGDALAGAGFDVVACATNHVLDRGVEGLDETLAYWREAHPEVSVLGIRSEGAHAFEPTYVEEKGFKLAFFDATYSLNGLTLPQGESGRVDLIGDAGALVHAVAAAESTCDLTVCVLHAGEEYAREPGADQLAWEERLVEAGADVVVCSHAHVVQGVSCVLTASGARGVVFHGLGNVVAAQDDPECVLGGAAYVVVGRTEDGEARVMAYALEGTVSHVSANSVEVRLLDAYDNAQAAEHGLNVREGDAVTAQGLREELFWAQQGGTSEAAERTMGGL